MGFSGCKIPGHSGTDRKNRKAFNKAKESKHIYLYKYGDQYGQSDNLEIDHRKMQLAEKRKIRKQIILLTCLFSVFIIIACMLSYWMAILDRKNPPVWNFDEPVITTKSVQLDINNFEFLKYGYLAWENKDFESAVLWFGYVNDHKGNWARKEYALFGVYKDMCSIQNQECDNADYYSSKVNSLFKIYSKTPNENISHRVDFYNAQMKNQFRQNKTREVMESISFTSLY